ncbi:hypothetical protein K7461_29750, partial [Pseudomonas fluorescens]|uniref:SGNH hydrolase domain-containing protein n=1 Tax=Pseudomonas fluorescens TaxID=294 RepID=UPI001CA7020C
SGRWAAYENRDTLYSEIPKTIAYLKNLGLRVVFVGQSPDFPDGIRNVIIRAENGKSAWPRLVKSIFDARTNEQLHTLAGNSFFFDPLSVNCDGDSCPIAEDGKPLFFDHGHFTNFGSIVFSTALVSALPK